MRKKFNREPAIYSCDRLLALNSRRAVYYVTFVVLGVMIPRMVSTVRTKPGVMVAELTEYCSTVGGAVGQLVSIGTHRNESRLGIK